MEELQIKISQEPAVIRCNFEDVKAQLSAKMAEYQGRYSLRNLRAWPRRSWHLFGRPEKK